MGREYQARDVFGDAQGLCAKPAGAVEHEDGVRALGDCLGYLDEVGVHRLGIGIGFRRQTESR